MKKIALCDADGYFAGMSSVFSSGFNPDPTDPVDVLAFVLCPVALFAPGASEAEIEAVTELMAPAKAEAIQRWVEAQKNSLRN